LVVASGGDVTPADIRFGKRGYPGRVTPVTPPSLSRRGWILLLGHALLALAWLVGMPQGFPASHVNLWVNRVVPLLLLLAVAAAWTSRETFAPWLFLTLAVAWVGALLAGPLWFPQSAARLGLLTSFGAAPMALVAWVFERRSAQLATRPALWRSACALGLVLGALAPGSQRGGPPTTRPAGEALPQPVAGPAPTVAALGTDVRVGLADGRVSLGLGGLHTTVWPLLRFRSRSADRCWTVFARARERIGPPRELLGYAGTPRRAQVDYRADGRLRLEVRATADGAELDAWAELPRPVYSHLNTFTELHVQGEPGRPLRLVFSPCPETPIEVRLADYPVGAPARLAYRAADGGFRVVEAQSAEKGPFRALAEGPLGDGPLTITVLSGDAPRGTIVLHDWARQAGTALSPTAGWGLPVNAVEFQLLQVEPPVLGAWITLAGTSVGRGWDSVGHAAGTYRNRITLSSVD